MVTSGVGLLRTFLSRTLAANKAPGNLYSRSSSADPDASYSAPDSEAEGARLPSLCPALRPQTPARDQIRVLRWAVDFDTPRQGGSDRQAHLLTRT